jgi:hypothetical protein
MQPIVNVVTVIGLPKDTDFNQWLESFWARPGMPKLGGRKWSELDPEISKVRSHQVFEDVSFPEFVITFKHVLWDELIEYSKTEGKGLVFHLLWEYTECENKYGVATFGNGEVWDQWSNSGGSEIHLAPIRDPLPDFLVAHAGLSLAQLAKYRLQKASEVVSKIGGILQDIIGDESFPTRDLEKTKSAIQKLTALAEQMKAVIDPLDFNGVILPGEAAQYSRR